MFGYIYTRVVSPRQKQCLTISVIFYIYNSNNNNTLPNIYKLITIIHTPPPPPTFNRRNVSHFTSDILTWKNCIWTQKIRTLLRWKENHHFRFGSTLVLKFVEPSLFRYAVLFFFSLSNSEFTYRRRRRVSDQIY